MRRPSDWPRELWQRLKGRLWHATGPRGLRSIVEDGEIRIGVVDRYKNALTRKLGCVSLFDFGPAAGKGMNAENLRSCIANMNGWLSGTRIPGGPRGVVWLEVDRERVQERLIDAAAMRALSRTESLSLRFIAGVEAGHRGPLPVSDLAGVLVIDGANLIPVHYYERITSDTVRRVEALPVVIAEPDDPFRRMLAKSAF